LPIALQFIFIDLWKTEKMRAIGILPLPKFSEKFHGQDGTAHYLAARDLGCVFYESRAGSFINKTPKIKNS